jgi:hypothetical protein
MQGKPVETLEGLSRVEVMSARRKREDHEDESARISTNLVSARQKVGLSWLRQQQTFSSSAVRNYRWTVGSGQQGKPMEGLRKEVMRVQEENEKEKAKKCLRKE